MATSIVDNGPFDPRITSIPFLQNAGGYQGSAGGKTLTRGFIIMENAVNNVKYRCNFLYNPSVVNLTHMLDSSVLADANSQVPDDVTSGHYLMPLSQSVTFSLLFDRTYELWDPSNLYGDAAQAVPLYGVAYDVLSLYKITGIAAPMVVPADGTAADQTSALSAFSKGMFSGGPAGPMINTQVYAVLGPSLSYYGYINELDIQYTHWTQAMIPMRCEVDVTMTLLPTPTSGNRYAPVTGPRAANYGDPLSVSQQLGNSGKAGR